jgi:transcriptional regulator GlxA family with amidase domain
MEKVTAAAEFQLPGLRVHEIRRNLHSSPYELAFTGRHQGLLRLKRWVAQHGALTLTLPRAAELACLTPHHFSAAFHKHTGETFKTWRHRVRICWAVSAIEAGRHSINEVMHLAGYQDRRAFERAIKHLTGTTPGCILKTAAGIDVVCALSAKSES